LFSAEEIKMNIAVVMGTVTRDAQSRMLPSGDELMSFDVSVRREGERTEVVPIVWIDRSDKLRDLSTDDNVVIFGRIRKRFYQTGAGLQSRTEVVADRVSTSKSRRSVASMFREIRDELDAYEAA
jgi:hypothetical protein